MPLALLVTIALLTLSAVSATRSYSKVADERKNLLPWIAAEQQHRGELITGAGELGTENRQLHQDVVASPSVHANLQKAGLVVDAIAVSSPGLRVRANDAEGAGNDNKVIYDSDLSHLVSGPWQARVEVVAMNDHRITTLASIRSAGSAIIVDHVSLNLPYVVEAIGNPSRLQVCFARISSAMW